MNPQFSALPFFAYPVTDMDRACAFYRNVLGLTEVARWDNVWVEFSLNAKASGPVIALSSIMDGCEPNAKGGAVALETTEFDATVAHLRSQNVTFVMEPSNTSACHFARFLDSEGNHVILHRIHEIAEGT